MQLVYPASLIANSSLEGVARRSVDIHYFVFDNAEGRLYIHLLSIETKSSITKNINVYTAR